MNTILKARDATFLEIRNYLDSIHWEVSNQDIYDFMDWIESNIFDDESLVGAWRRYNSVDFQGDCV